MTVRVNQDRLRASIDSMDRGAVANALSWARGEGAFPSPVSIHWDLTLRCTARCTHCLQWSWPDQDELTYDQLDKMFSILTRWGIGTLTLGGGNPLLYPHLARVLSLASEAGISVGMITEGGVELDEVLIKEMGRALSWIRFSLDGPRAPIHDAIRNSPGLFDMTISTIARLHHEMPALTIGINCVVQRQNMRHLSEMRKLASDLGVSVLLFKIPHGRDVQHRYVPTAAEWADIVSWVSEERLRSADTDSGPVTNLSELSELLGRSLPIADLARGRPVSSYYRSRRARCYVPLFFLVCDSRGDVYPCDYLQADTRSWRGGGYKEVRQQFCVGNIIADGDLVLERLGYLLRERVHTLPGDGYDECGSCTRFFQWNSSLTGLDDALPGGPMSEETLTLTLGDGPTRRNAFL